ncbi:MAG: PHP-associated domain-containing protein [Anaerosomatales bacterium]|nr:PHP-associated domain-containing protein [Anaerosomatales bacterium]
MAEYTLDLHNHTPLIPGDYRGRLDTTPAEIVRAALDAGIDVLGVTDHFSAAYAPRIVQAADDVWREEGRRLHIIPGAEIKIRRDGDEAHLIALFAAGSAERRLSALLAVLGLPDPAAPLEGLPALSVSYDPLVAARAIDTLGGLCIVGHADRTFGEYRLSESPLVGELMASPHVSAIEMIDHACLGTLPGGSDVACVQSSDAHAPGEMGRRTTRLSMSEPTLEGLRDALKRARRPRVQARTAGDAAAVIR